MTWTTYDTWIVVTGALCAIACALPGVFLVLRKMAMMGDAISHAVLPGLALAFLFTGSRVSVWMLIGAIGTGLFTALFTQWIARFGEFHRGAAMGVVFTSLFALGLLLISNAAEHVDLDPGCVLYGAIELAPLDRITLLGAEIPRAAAVLGGVALANLLIIALFFKELRLTAFDGSYADASGISSEFLHYLLMTLVALTAVAAFETVGSIIVIAMLVVPSATALLVTHRLSHILWLSSLMGVCAAGLGHVAAILLPKIFDLPATNSAGMMAVAAGMFFALAWACAGLRKWLGIHRSYVVTQTTEGNKSC